MSAAAPQRAFGWIRDPDVRDANYQMSERLDLEATLPPYRFHACRLPVDQGSTGGCVGGSLRNFMQAAPVMVRIGDGWTWRQIYDWAQLHDGFEGQEPEMRGTSLRAGMQALQEAGAVGSYVWASDMETVKAWVLQRGPVVMGTMWKAGMMQADANNTIHATGEVQGGHAYCVVGHSLKRGCYRLLNSWGNWAQNGRAWISETDLAGLFVGGGEAVTALEAGS